MSDAGNVAKSLRERLGGNAEDRLGRALSELLENPLLTGAIGRAFDAREKAAQAQEVAMGALNIPSAADIERLTRRLRAVSHRLEGIEDGVDRLDRALTPSGVEARLAAIESQLELCPRSSTARCATTVAGSRAGARTAHTDKQVGAARAAKAGRTGRQDDALDESRRKARAQGAPRPAKPELSATGPRSPPRPCARPRRGGRGRDAGAPALLVEGVGDGQQAADRDGFEASEREQRRRLHLHRERARRRPPSDRARRTGPRSRRRRRAPPAPRRGALASAPRRPRPVRPRRARVRCRRR